MYTYHDKFRLILSRLLEELKQTRRQCLALTTVQQTFLTYFQTEKNNIVISYYLSSAQPFHRLWKRQTKLSYLTRAEYTEVF